MMKRMMVTALMVMVSQASLADRAIDETKAAPADGSVTVDIVSGSIVVTGWDRNEVRVTGRIGDDVEEFVFETRANETEIRVKLPQGRRRIDGHAHLEIHVPVRSSLSVSVISAPITVSNVGGENHRLKAVSGNVKATGCSGNLNIETISGGIEVDGVHDSAEVKAVSGRIKVRGVEGTLRAETVSGSIDSEGSQLTRGVFKTVSGAVSYTGGVAENGQIDAESISGRVRLKFDGAVFGRYDIETFNGRIQFNFGPSPLLWQDSEQFWPQTRKGRFGPGERLVFTHGSGNARVSVQTFSGAVTIEAPE